ncbi:MAG: glycosyltransferase family 4 protein [Shimia sp.]
MTHSMTHSLAYPPLAHALLVAAIAFLLVGLVVSASGQAWARRWLLRGGDTVAVQASHSRPTPRVGGIAVLIALAAGWLALAPSGAAPVVTGLLLSALPVVLAGAAEDLGHRVSSRGRLLAAAVSAGVAVAVLGTWIGGTGVAWIDPLFAVPALAILVTVLWSTGLCHATNLIDGMNGLAGTACIVIALALAALAARAGDPQMAVPMALVAAAVAGFLVWNWPYGRVFLGDAGAYGLGHLLAWGGIVIAARNPEVAGMAVALIFFWPVADTFFAIWRRKRAGRAVDAPDRMHVHQLVRRGLEVLWLGKSRRDVANAATTLVLAPLLAMPAVVAVLVWDAGPLALAALVGFAVLFVAFYQAGVTCVRQRRLRLAASPFARLVPEADLHRMAPRRAEQIDPTGTLRLFRLGTGDVGRWSADVAVEGGARWLTLDRSFPDDTAARRSALWARRRHALKRRLRGR